MKQNPHSLFSLSIIDESKTISETVTFVEDHLELVLCLLSKDKFIMYALQSGNCQFYKSVEERCYNGGMEMIGPKGFNIEKTKKELSLILSDCVKLNNEQEYQFDRHISRVCTKSALEHIVKSFSELGPADTSTLTTLLSSISFAPVTPIYSQLFESVRIHLTNLVNSFYGKNKLALHANASAFTSTLKTLDDVGDHRSISDKAFLEFLQCVTRASKRLSAAESELLNTWTPISPFNPSIAPIIKSRYVYKCVVNAEWFAMEIAKTGMKIEWSGYLKASSELKRVNNSSWKDYEHINENSEKKFNAIFANLPSSAAQPPEIYERETRICYFAAIIVSFLISLFVLIYIGRKNDKIAKQ